MSIPVIFRIGFAISIFFGGLGALAYLLLAVFVPTDGEPDRAQRAGSRLKAMGFWRTLAMVGIVLIALAGLFALAGGAAFAVGLGWGVPVAIGIIVIGAVLALLAFRGGARWLIPPVVAIMIGAGTASAADLDFRGGIGEREHHPLSAESIPADGYRLGIGRLVVDLRDLDWNAARVVTSRSSSAPARRTSSSLSASASPAPHTWASARASSPASETTESTSTTKRPRGRMRTPRLELDATVDVGPAESDQQRHSRRRRLGYDPDSFHEDAPQRAAEASACASG